MRIGVCSWSFAGVLRGHRPLAELTSAARSAGFEALEAAYWHRCDLASEAPALPSLAVPASSLATLELHRVFLTDERAERRQRAISVVDRMIDCAARLGMATVSFSPGGWPEGTKCSVVLDHLVETLGPLVVRAAKAGIVLALENLPDSCVACRSDMAAVLRRLPGLGLCLDIGNTLVSPPTAGWIDEFGERIVKLHISDGEVNGTCFTARLPAEGRVCWTGLRPLLACLPAGLEAFVEAPLPSGKAEDLFLSRLWQRTQQALGS